MIHSEDVIRAVSDSFSVSIEDLTGPRRDRPVVTARHVAARLLRDCTNMSLPSIGRALGGRDHTSIINSLRRYNDLEKDMEVVPMIAAARLALVAPVFRSVRGGNVATR